MDTTTDVMIPDFQVYSNAFEVLAKEGHPLFPQLQSTDDMPVLPVTSSSTEMDLYEDTMSMTALQDMCTSPLGQSIFRDHVYSVPNNYFGKLVVQPIIVSDHQVADLHEAYGIYIKDADNAKTYDQIKSFGARHGVSVGVMVLEYHFDGDPDDWFAPIIIDHVYRVETSVVGIPASQRSWVENAIGGVFLRHVREDNGEEAIKLAPAYKGLFSNDYRELVKSLRSDGLRKELERRPIRAVTGTKAKLSWEPIKRHFVFQRGNRSQIVERAAIPELLRHQSLRPMEQKAVGGKTSWELMALDTEWTGSKAEKEIFAYARNDDDEIVASKAKQCFLYNDPDHLDVQSGYKMAFCYVPGDIPKIVPLGVRAAANVLSGGRGGLSGVSDEDISSMKSKVKTLYNRINKELTPDPEWVVPWEQEDKSMKPDTTKDAADGDPPKASEVEVGSDGSHVACTGTHTHSHASYGSQGDDSTHEHSHSHDNDATHDHPHEEKAGEPQSTTGFDETSPLYKAWKALGEQLGITDVPVTTFSQDAVNATMQRAFEHVLTIKAGQEFSKENKGYVKAIHDAVTSMVGSEFCNTDASQGDGDNDEDDNNDAASSKGIASVTQTTWLYKQFEGLVKAQTDIHTGIQGLITTLKGIPGIQDNITVLTKQAAALEGQFKTAQVQVNAVLGDVMKLKNMPLGNPRGLERQVTPTADNGVASYQDMLSVNGLPDRQWTLQECKSLTEIKTLPYGSQTITVRHWPVSVGGKAKSKGGARPELTMAQKSHMHYNDWYEYEEGNAVDVPMIDDPFDSVA